MKNIKSFNEIQLRDIKDPSDASETMVKSYMRSSDLSPILKESPHDYN